MKKFNGFEVCWSELEWGSSVRFGSEAGPNSVWFEGSSKFGLAVMLARIRFGLSAQANSVWQCGWREFGLV